MVELDVAGDYLFFLLNGRVVVGVTVCLPHVLDVLVGLVCVPLISDPKG